MSRKENEVSRAANHEPPPVRGQEEVLQMVLDDINSRADVGLRKYGRRLETFNGRDALMDAYQEACDLVMYLRQAICERDSKGPDAK